MGETCYGLVIVTNAVTITTGKIGKFREGRRVLSQVRTQHGKTQILKDLLFIVLKGGLRFEPNPAFSYTRSIY